MTGERNPSAGRYRCAYCGPRVSLRGTSGTADNRDGEEVLPSDVLWRYRPAGFGRVLRSGSYVPSYDLDGWERLPEPGGVMAWLSRLWGRLNAMGIEE